MSVNLNTLSIEELQELALQAQAKAEQLRTQQQLDELEESEGRKIRISEAVDKLTTLLGPEDTTPYDPAGSTAPSIRSLLVHPKEVLAQNSGLALQLIFQGLEEITITTRDLAEVMRSYE